MSECLPWAPVAGPEMLRARARLLADIRGFFQGLGVMEVETPVCSGCASTDPMLESFTTSFTGPGVPEAKELFLHTSPEFPMKRLLAAGSGPVYQMCKVFRNGESGRMHNPEFTLLEWYRPGYDHHRLMGEVAELINGLLPAPLPVERISYGELFQGHLGLDPHRCSVEEMRGHAIKAGVTGSESLDLHSVDGWLDLLLTHCIEPHLGRGSLCFVYDYPATQASLSRIRPGTPPLAERFELYIEGIELANGFHELASGPEQRGRFNADLEQRRTNGAREVPMDELLLAALDAGLPECSGVALGVDRLLMCLTGTSHIQDVLAFPLERA
ncbi:MAG: EF-P lysine aminoacylase GenX [Gammaproteobacteria bacterium]|nr:EF-P lysine aminoacylase GenX [Gammaproteobacteria bacterium]